jgi:hypothetical protein
VGSDTVDIDRVYGTASQKIRYPKYTDMLKYGITSVPRPTTVENSHETGGSSFKKKTSETFVSYSGDEFYG